jgi:hypothetical protein
LSAGPGDSGEERRRSAPPESPARPGDDELGRSPARTPEKERRTGDAADDVFYCDLCGEEMLNLHCKLICEHCGYKRDCSDP